MSKKMALILIVAMLLGACQPMTNGEVTSQTTTATTSQTQTTTQEETTTIASTSQSNQTLQAKPVLYDNVINKDMYSGFTDRQLKMLQDNGFVVLPFKYSEYFATFMHMFYEGAEYGDYALLITSDAVLNMYHMFYSGSLKALESTYHYDNITTVSNGLLAQAAANYQQCSPELKPYYKKLYAYFGLGSKLLFEETLDLSASQSFDKQSLKHQLLSKLKQSSEQWQTLQSAIPSEVQSLIDADYQSITAKAGLLKSVILDKDVDFTQYTVRGHYTASALLSNYFKGMMWYSQSGYDISNKPEDTEKLIISQLISLMIANDSQVEQAWQALYQLTKLYSGQGNNLSYEDMTGFMQTVYGSDYQSLSAVDNQAILLDSTYDNKRQQAIEQLPLPTFTPEVKVVDTDIPYERQFRLMSQRYTFDAYVMQNLTEPLKRVNISSFDVLTVFGSQKAEEVLYEYYKPNEKWPEYDQELARMKEDYQQRKDQFFTDDLYHGWLKLIALVLDTPQVNNLPYFMTTNAYQYKNINTALGSFAELKHDNVLYAQQMAAEAGGPNDEAAKPLHYVEPNVALYQQLSQLLAKTQAGLKQHGVDDEEISGPIDEMQRYVTLFETVSQKQLNGEPTSHDELVEIGYFGGMVDYIKNNYQYYLASLGLGDYEAEKSSALISDIATIFDMGYLELGTGLPYDIYALVNINGQDVMVRGVVYSSYEFFSAKRLTDQEWQKMLGIKQNYDDELDTSNVPLLIDIMPYAKHFVSPEPNNVTTEYIEMVWPKAE